MSTKIKVLEILEQNRAQAISGQELAETLHVSRAAIWKAIKSLQDEGHKIQATTNKGYQLEAESDLLSEAGIRCFLWEENRTLPIQIYKIVDSTNSQAKRIAIDGASHGTLLLAEEQTAGRGRRGRSFFSPAETGLYMSLVLRLKTNIADSLLITAAAAVAVCKAIERVTGLDPQIKWVNDIYLGGKKICGILTEAVSDFESGRIESVVVGIGLNCTTGREAFPEELRETAGSLLASDLSRNQMAAEIANEIFLWSEKLTDSVVIEEYRKRSLALGKEIVYEDKEGKASGRVREINDRGNLVVETASGKIDVLIAGEVSIKGSWV